MQTKMADTTKSHERSIRRILVALNSCSNEEAAIESAAVLAQQLEAELAGLFIEDVNLLHLAEFPFAQEIFATHLSRRLFDTAQLQLSMRAEAERVRQTLRRWADQHSVSWRFVRTQGHLLAETVTASESMDLLVIGRDCQSAIVGSTAVEMAGRIVRQSRCSVLIAAARGSHPYRKVAILIDESSESKAVLATGAALARREELPLRLVLIAPDDEHCSRLRRECDSVLAGFPCEATVEGCADSTAAVARLSTDEPLFLVLGQERLGVDESLFGQLFQSLRGPILIVR